MGELGRGDIYQGFFIFPLSDFLPVPPIGLTQLETRRQQGPLFQHGPFIRGQPLRTQSRMGNKSIKWIQRVKWRICSPDCPFQASSELLHWFAESRKHLGKNKVHLVYHFFGALFITNKQNGKVEQAVCNCRMVSTFLKWRIECSKDYKQTKKKMMKKNESFRVWSDAFIFELLSKQ